MDGSEVENCVILNEYGHLAINRKFDSFHNANSFIARAEADYRQLRAKQKPPGYRETGPELAVWDTVAMLGRHPRVADIEEARRGVARSELAAMGGDEQ